MPTRRELTEQVMDLKKQLADAVAIGSQTPSFTSPGLVGLLTPMQEEMETVELANAKKLGLKTDREIEALERPVWKLPTTWFSGMLALVAVGGFALQYSLLNFDLKQAKLDATAAEEKTTKAQNELFIASQQRDAANKESLSLRAQIEKDQSLLESTKAQVTQYRQELNRAISALGTIIERKGVPLVGNEITLEGTIVDSHGKGITLATINLTRDGEDLPSPLTDENGTFKTRVPVGKPGSKLKVSWVHPGHMPESIELDGDCSYSLRLPLFDPLQRLFPDLHEQNN